MLSVIYTLIPVILIILIGMILKRISIFSDESWVGVEHLCYFVLFPALLIKTVAIARLEAIDLLYFSAMLLFAIITMSGILLLLYPVLNRGFRISAASFTSLLQGATRWNGFIALSIVGLLIGEKGLAYMAITMVVIIPPLNIINVAVLAAFTSEEQSLSSVFLRLLQNPFIIACLIGALLNLSGIGLPSLLLPVFDIIGGGALGLGLLTVGAGVRFGLIADRRFLIAFGSLLRLLGMPLIMFIGAWLFGIEGVPLTVAVIAGAVPAASSSYILARQMGGDAPLMASLITVQLMVSTLTLPVMIWLSGIPPG